MKFFPRIDVLCIDFRPDGEAEFSMDEPKSAAANPLVAVVSGNGVITKDLSAVGVVQTVTSDPETFLWTIDESRISFVRREQLDSIADRLERFAPLHVECLPCTDEEAINGVVARFRAEHLGWRRVLRPSADGSRLASLVVRRLRLPVLGFLMLILVANFAVSGVVREDLRQTGLELSSLQRSSSAVVASSENRRAVAERFSRSMPFRASRLSDRIGGAAPDGVALTEIAIAPLTKDPEAGKPVQQRENMVIVRGETTHSEAIAEFTNALGRLRLGTMRLAALEQERDKGTLTFRIEIKL